MCAQSQLAIRQANAAGCPFGKVVTLLEILRVHAEAYTQGVYSLSLILQRIESSPGDFRLDEALMGRIHGHLSKLLPYCEGLPLTVLKIKNVLNLVENIQITARWQEPKLGFLTAIAEIRSRLDDELSTLLFFRLPAERAHYFDNYREGWEEVIARFPETISDIEEMSKCFALSRYTAAVFHSLLTVEWGVIHLGTFIGVTDPKRGWDATCKKLSAIMTGGHSNAPAALAPHFGFLEQTNQCVQTMKHAWRNKVNHSDGKLAVLGSDFTPDIAEEIIMAARSFMRRLATEMP